MWAVRCVVVTALGCSFHRGAPPALVDSIGGDTPGGCGWTSPHFDPCAIPQPMGDVTLSAVQSPLTYDTTTGGGSLVDALGMVIPIVAIDDTQNGGVHAALWSVGTLTIAAGVELDVIGEKPLIVAAWGDLAVGGTIDAGSHLGGRTGAGSNPDACQSHAAGQGGPGLSGTGGGGGAGFAGSGAAGGDADSNCAPNPPACQQPGGAGGGAVAAPAIVVGGCSGGESGLSTTTGAAGGPGGGAILLATRGTLTISGTVVAGGAGGAPDPGAAVSIGGGGGGAGGFLGLEAAMIDVTGATIAANGGGGGGGADIANAGTPGADGGAGVGPAPGGITGSGGTDGGVGSSQTTLDGGPVMGAVPVGGGGGGGGAAGFVLYWTMQYGGSAATISPPAQAGP